LLLFRDDAAHAVVGAGERKACDSTACHSVRRAAVI
jgi:hypothetical protein